MIYVFTIGIIEFIVNRQKTIKTKTTKKWQICHFLEIYMLLFVPYGRKLADHGLKLVYCFFKVISLRHFRWKPTLHVHTTRQALKGWPLNQWRSHWGVRGAEYHPWQQKICQISGKRGQKSGKIRKKEEKSGRKGRNWEGSFTLPLVTDRAGYATD